MTNDPVIVAAVRSPTGRSGHGGALHEVYAVDLLAQVVRGLLAAADVDPGVVDGVFVGGGSLCGGVDVAREAWLSAGFADDVPVLTMGPRCGSSLQAAQFAAHGVMAGSVNVAVVAGVARVGSGLVGTTAWRQDARQGTDVGRPRLAAERVAACSKLSRPQLDEYAARSHRRAAACSAAGDFRSELVEIMTPGGRQVDADECVDAAGVTYDVLARCTPWSPDPAAAMLLPDGYTSTVTSGNSAPNGEGAFAMLVMGARRAGQLGIRARARFEAFSTTVSDPLLASTGPIRASRTVLARAAMVVEELDHIEIDEAFAAVPLAWQAAFDADPRLLNPRGAAIALGNVAGAGAGRSLVTMLGALEATGGRYGLVAASEIDGVSSAAVIERL